MVRIDFGPSSFARNSPSVLREELEDYGVVEIPETGDLPFVDCYVRLRTGSFPLPQDYRKIYNTELEGIEPIRKTVDGRPAVGLTLYEAFQKDEILYLIWVEERREWIAIAEEGWLESDSWGCDTSRHGPYGLDEYHAKKILQAYGLQTDQIPSDEVLHRNPLSLEDSIA